MDALIEVILEIIFEFMAEFGFVLIGKVFDKAETDKKALKITKIIIYSFLAILLLILLIVSLIYKKGLLVGIVLSYFIFILLAYYLIFIFRTVTINPIAEKFVRWTVRITRYIFTIGLIVVGALYLNDEGAKILLITGSVIGILIYIFIDAFRIYRVNNRIKKEENINE